MSASLQEVWDAAANQPFEPFVSKENHFTVAFVLLFIAFALSAAFALNRSLVTLPALGIPASVAFGFGAVYMICAVGVYV